MVTGVARSKGLKKRRKKIRMESSPWAAEIPEAVAAHDVLVIYGGRVSSKSTEVAIYILKRIMARYERVACVREVTETTKHSVFDVFKRLLLKHDLMDKFALTNTYMRHIKTGSLVTFHGLSTQTEQGIRSLEGVTITWLEEGHTIQRDHLETLVPTVLREEGAKLFVTFNPQHPDDAVWQRFVSEKGIEVSDETVWTKLVNYPENRFLSDTAKRQLERLKERDPDDFAHVYLGQFKPDKGAKKVLPYGLASMCVDAHKREEFVRRFPDWKPSGRRDAGWDVADEGYEGNVLSIRQGPMLEWVRQWTASGLLDATGTADQVCRDAKLRRLFYDSGGLGAGVRGFMAVYATERGMRNYALEPTFFNGRVEGADNEYMDGATNQDFFRSRNSQLAWALRLRAENTKRLLEGDESVYPDDCLIIDSEALRRAGWSVEEYLLDISQPMYREDQSSKIVIEKSPDGKPSPHGFDSLCLAFSWDSADEGLAIE